MTDEEWLLLGFTQEDLKNDKLIQAAFKWERQRIIEAIENAPPAMDFFGPYISKEKLYAVINGLNATDFAGSTLPKSQGENE